MCGASCIVVNTIAKVILAAPKILENFGVREFFAAKSDKTAWVKMWVGGLARTVTRMRK